MIDETKLNGAFVPEELIGDLMKSAEYQVFSGVFGKLTIVAAKVANGYTLVGSSGCVDPDNYSREIGMEICKKQIRDQLWALEGYALQVREHDKASK